MPLSEISDYVDSMGNLTLSEKQMEVWGVRVGWEKRRDWEQG